MDATNIVFKIIDDYNTTILSAKNRSLKLSMTFDERRGILYNVMRRNLPGINNIRFQSDYLNPIFRLDGTLQNLEFKIPAYSNSWDDRNDYTNILKQINKYLRDSVPLGKTKDQLQLCDIVNNIKNYQF